MLLNKTDKARAALRDGANTGLSLQERRVLILTDGKRSLNDVMGMLGPGILPAIDRLMREGYIGDASAPTATATRTPTLGGAVTGLIRAATEAVQARTAQVQATTLSATATQPAATSVATYAAPLVAAVAAPPPRAGTRRSLAAAKMYMLDMLQLQRSPEANELRAEIQCTVGSEPMIEVLLRALRLLQQLSTASYAQRVAARLAEILPEEALPRLEAIRSEHAGMPALSIVAA